MITTLTLDLGDGLDVVVEYDPATESGGAILRRAGKQLPFYPQLTQEDWTEGWHSYTWNLTRGSLGHLGLYGATDGLAREALDAAGITPGQIETLAIEALGLPLPPQAAPASPYGLVAGHAEFGDTHPAGAVPGRGE